MMVGRSVVRCTCDNALMCAAVTGSTARRARGACTTSSAWRAAGPPRAAAASPDTPSLTISSLRYVTCTIAFTLLLNATNVSRRTNN